MFLERLRSFATRLCAATLTGFAMLGVAEVVVRVWIPVRNVGPSFTVYDAEDGVALKKSFVCERITPEFTMRLTTNALGFRGPAPSGEPGGVLFLGDSFTLGYGVDDGEEFPALVGAHLERRLDRSVPIWNAGVGGTGNGRWLSFLRQEARELDPDLVVLQLCGNDFEDNLREGLFALDEDGELERLQAHAPSLRRSLQGVVEGVPGLAYSHLIGSLRGLRSGAAEVHAPAPSGLEETLEPADELTWRLVEHALDECERSGWPVLVVAAALEEGRLRRLTDLAAERAFPLVVVPSRAERPDLYYRVDGHWNLRGHAYAAWRVAAELGPLCRAGG